jgi:acyl carrier protein
MVRDVIVGTLGQVLGTGPDPAATTFAEIPGFDSFRLVDLIEQAERALGTEIPADELVPENLADVESLTALFVRCLARGPVDA